MHRAPAQCETRSRRRCALAVGDESTGRIPAGLSPLGSASRLWMATMNGKTIESSLNSRFHIPSTSGLLVLPVLPVVVVLRKEATEPPGAVVMMIIEVFLHLAESPRRSRRRRNECPRSRSRSPRRRRRGEPRKRTLWAKDEVPINALVCRRGGSRRN